MSSVKLLMASLVFLPLSACAIPAVNDALMGGPTATLVPSASSPNPYGIVGKVNMRDAQSLRSSLEAMVGGLSQKDQLAFMETFFRVAYFDRCDETGQWRDRGNSFNGGRRSFGSCARTAYDAGFFGKLALTYVSDKRMDQDFAYTSTNLYGTRTGGSSANESFVNFINLYGGVMDGRDADYINWRNSAIMRRKAESQRGQY